MGNTKLIKSLIVQDPSTNQYKASIQAGYGPYPSEQAALVGLTNTYGAGNIPKGATCLIALGDVLYEVWWNGSTLVNKSTPNGSQVQESPYSISVQNGVLIPDNDYVGTLNNTVYKIYKGSTLCTITNITATPPANCGISVTVINSGGVLQYNKSTAMSERTISIPITIVFTDNGQEIIMQTQQEIIVKDYSNGDFYEMVVQPTAYTEFTDSETFMADITVYRTRKGNRTIVPNPDIEMYLLVDGDPYKAIPDSQYYAMPFDEAANPNSQDQYTSIPLECTGVRFDLYVTYNNSRILVDSDTIAITHRGQQGDKGDPGDDGHPADMEELVSQLVNSISTPSVRIRLPENGETYYWLTESSNNLVMWNDLIEVKVVSGTTITSKYYRVKQTNGIPQQQTISGKLDNETWAEYFQRNSDKWAENNSVSIIDSAYIATLTSNLVNTEELVITDTSQNEAAVIAGASGKRGEITLQSTPSEEDAAKLRSAGFIQVGDSLVWRQNLKDKIMFWAGSNFGSSDPSANIKIAQSAFKVLGDGTVYAKKFKGVGDFSQPIGVVTDIGQCSYIVNTGTEQSPTYHLDVLHCPNRILFLKTVSGGVKLGYNYINTTLDGTVPFRMSNTQMGSLIGKEVTIIVPPNCGVNLNCVRRSDDNYFSTQNALETNFTSNGSCIGSVGYNASCKVHSFKITDVVNGVFVFEYSGLGGNSDAFYDRTLNDVNTETGDAIRLDYECDEDNNDEYSFKSLSFERDVPSETASIRVEIPSLYLTSSYNDYTQNTQARWKITTQSLNDQPTELYNNVGGVCSTFEYPYGTPGKVRCELITPSSENYYCLKPEGIDDVLSTDDIQSMLEGQDDENRYTPIVFDLFFV